VADFQKRKIFPFDQHAQFFQTTYVRNVSWRTILNSCRKGIWSGCWRNVSRKFWKGSIHQL